MDTQTKTLPVFDNYGNVSVGNYVGCLDSLPDAYALQCSINANLLAALEGIFAQTAKHSRQWGQSEGALAFARDPDTAKAFFTAREALKRAKGQA